MSNPILSIGMIVKNESRHLRNCLNALKPLMKKVRSELIIADTGSTDDTVRIAREFTSNVLEIPWNDDFSEARNYTIRAAKGEWYMFIDADEYLEDSKELVRFFKQGLYKNAEAASYFVRNYTSDTEYKESANCRLCKLTEDTKFTGSVHEALPHHLTAKLINSYVRHHGYIDENNPELLQQKMMRNLPLLLKRHEEDPTELLVIRNLFFTYMEMKEQDKAKELLDAGLNIIQRDAEHVGFPAYYQMLIYFYSHADIADADKKIIETVDDCLMIKPRLSIASIYMLISKATSCSVLKNYSIAAKCLEAAYELQQLYKENKLDVTEISSISSHNISPQSVDMVVEKIAGSYLMMEDYNNAFIWLERMPFQNANDLNRWHTAIMNSNQPERFGTLFKRIADLSESGCDIKLIDYLIEQYNAKVLFLPSAAKIIQPFFNLYQKIMSEHLNRTVFSNGASDEIVEKLPTAYRIVYHMDMAEKLKKQKDEQSAMKHMKTAMRTDSRFVPIITSKMRER